MYFHELSWRLFVHTDFKIFCTQIHLFLILHFRGCFDALMQLLHLCVWWEDCAFHRQKGSSSEKGRDHLQQAASGQSPLHQWATRLLLTLVCLPSIRSWLWGVTRWIAIHFILFFWRISNISKNGVNCKMHPESLLLAPSALPSHCPFNFFEGNLSYWRFHLLISCGIFF